MENLVKSIEHNQMKSNDCDSIVEQSNINRIRIKNTNPGPKDLTFSHLN